MVQQIFFPIGKVTTAKRGSNSWLSVSASVFIDLSMWSPMASLDRTVHIEGYAI